MVSAKVDVFNAKTRRSFESITHIASKAKVNKNGELLHLRIFAL